MEKNNVEVCYASEDRQTILEVETTLGETIEDVIKKSGVLDIHPEINLTKNKVGVFSKQFPLSHVVTKGDRIEIYRPLKIDPKEARRLKASKNNSNRAKSHEKNSK